LGNLSIDEVVILTETCCYVKRFLTLFCNTFKHLN